MLSHLFFYLLLCLNLCHFVLAKGGGHAASSAGGTGGSSGGSTASYGHGYRGTGGGGCNRTCSILLSSILGTFAASFLCCCFGGCFFHLKRKKAFQELVDRADRELMQDAMSSTKDSTHRPAIHCTEAGFSGSYTDSTYSDGTHPLKCMGHFVFKEIPTKKTDTATIQNAASNCRTITGKGVDQDGPLKITEGKVSIWTGKAYFVEKSRRKALVTGTFNWDPTTYSLTFSGEFICNNKASGVYTNLVIEPFAEGKDVNLVSNAVSLAVTGSPRYSHPPDNPPSAYAANPVSVARSAAGYTAVTADTSVTSGVPSIFSPAQTDANYASPPAYLSVPAPAAPSKQVYDGEPPAYLSTPAPEQPSNKDYSGVPSIFRPPP
jgi:hypothetical protein